MSDALWEGLREGCGTCMFGDVQTLGMGAHVVVNCRRYPPTLLNIEQINHGGGVNWWQVEHHRPAMAESDWCGEYKRKIPT